MFILIRHPLTGKAAIYLNRYNSVTRLCYELFTHSANVFPRHHLYPLLSFFRYLNDLGYLISLHTYLPKDVQASINLILSQDLSAYIIGIVRSTRANNPSVRTLLLLTEHPSYQKNLLTGDTLDIFDETYTSMDISHPNVVPIFTPYIFRTIPRFSSHPNTYSSKIYDAVLISSNLSNRDGSTYGLRRHIINILSELDCLDFGFYGRGWRLSDCMSNLRMLGKYSLSNLTHDVRLTKRSLAAYGGEILDKAILLQSKCCISIENHLDPNGYSTEKLIEPLIYSSIPLYLGSHDFSGIRDILPAAVLPLIENKDAGDIVRSCLFVSSMSISDANSLACLLRGAINDYLESNCFPTGLWKASQSIKESLA